MNRLIASGMLAASLTAGAGCAAEQDMSFPAADQLTVAHSTYSYNPVEVGPKGSGELGTASQPLAAGEIVVAECVVRHEGDTEGLADSIRIGEGEFKGNEVPLVVFESADDPIDVFFFPPEYIRRNIGFCDQSE